MSKKPHPLKGRKLSPETMAKRRASYAAKRAAKGQLPVIAAETTAPRSLAGIPTVSVTDVVVYLQHANQAFNQPWPRKHHGLMPPAQLYVQLALQTLLGRV